MKYEKINIGKAKDLTNQKFGKWTPLYRIKIPNKKGTYWLCQCDCHGENSLKPVDAASLTSGRSISCGCSLKENVKTKYNKGDKIGHWTILSYEGDGKYKCQCDCEWASIEIRELESIARKNSRCKKCGTNALVDLTGQKFGHWTVLRRGSGPTKKHTYWECECDCNNHTIKSIDAYKLKTGKSTSCGCDTRSAGEKIIAFILTKNNINFVQEKTFENLKGKNSNNYRFDFYVENKYIIEYDGIQHFSSLGGKWDIGNKLEETQKRDMLKDQWCKENNIPLIRIPYTHFDDLCIEDLLLETSEFIV